MGRTTNRNSWALGHQLLDFFKIRPYTGSLSKDFLFLLIISALHYSVIPSIVGRSILVDLLTPWLVVTMVAGSTSKWIFLTLLGAFLMETRTSAPAGMYLTSYWMIGTGIYLTRTSLSWRHYLPWFLTLLIAQLWVILTELFVNHVMLGHWHLSIQEILAQSSRLIFAVGFGMILCRKFRSCELPVETP
jgi:hypothetical protein